MKQACRKCHEEKELDKFPQNLSYRNGKASICKLCQANDVRYWRKENEHRYKAKKFKVPVEEIEKLLLQTECQICGNTDERRKLSIDHCHTTGRLRGLLCDNCNKGLGLFKDNPKILANAIYYLGVKDASSMVHVDAGVELFDRG